MKKLSPFLLLLAFTFVSTTKSEGQYNRFTFDKTTTASGADTATGNVNYSASAATSLTFSVTKVSGTLAGKVYVYGSNVGNTYTLLDSATVTNTTGTKDYDFNAVTNPTKFIGAPNFYKYQFYYLQTGGAATIAGRALLRGTNR